MACETPDRYCIDRILGDEIESLYGDAFNILDEAAQEETTVESHDESICRNKSLLW